MTKVTLKEAVEIMKWPAIGVAMSLPIFGVWFWPESLEAIPLPLAVLYAVTFLAVNARATWSYWMNRRTFFPVTQKTN